MAEFGLSGHDGPAFAIIRAVLLASLLAFNFVVAIDATSTLARTAGFRLHFAYKGLCIA